MANLIRHFCEPERLYLAWQAPDGVGTRFRWAVAVIAPADDGIRLRYLTGAEFEAANQGRNYSEILSLGYQGYPAFNPRRPEHSEGVIEAFLRRLPPRNRPDYATYQKQFCLDPQAQLSDLAMLAATEAKLPSDGFSLVDPLEPSIAECDLMLEVAGFRYYKKDLDFPIAVGQRVQLRHEPTNEKDPNAIALLIESHTIGYINRLQTSTFLKWIDQRSVTAEIERLNGSQNKPRAFIFVRVRPRQDRFEAA